MLSRYDAGVVPKSRAGRDFECRARRRATFRSWTRQWVVGVPSRHFALVAALGIAATSGPACTPDARSVGVPRATSVFHDLGRAEGGSRLRALVSVRLADPDGLHALSAAIADPRSPTFQRYLRPEDANARFAPKADDVAAVRAFAEAHGLEVGQVTSNGLLVELRGSVAAFEAAFSTYVHLYEHAKESFLVYGTPDGLVLPPDVPALTAVAAIDAPVLSPKGAVTKSEPGPPTDVGYGPRTIARAYGFDRVAERGEGAAIGVVTGGSVSTPDVKAFLDAFGVERASPEIRELLEPAPRDVFEATFDVEWAAVLAPGARVVVFQAPDPRTTSLLFSFTEAVTSGAVDVVTDSYAHYESTEPAATRELYDTAAELGAVIGVTVVAAAGDSARVDIPASCPFVTAVGGTRLAVDEDAAGNETFHEEAWERSGAGVSTFGIPPWQRDVAGGDRRVVVDVALNAATPYAAVHRGAWRSAAGTSVASPVFAAMVAIVDAERRGKGRPVVGFLNPILYRDAVVQSAFRDTTTGATAEHGAAKGWDLPTGWGAPQADALLSTLP